MEITTWAQSKEEKPHALPAMLLAHLHLIYKVQTQTSLNIFCFGKHFDIGVLDLI